MRQINSQIQAFLGAFESDEQEDAWNYLGEAQDFCDEFLQALPQKYHVEFPEVLAFVNWVETFSECLEQNHLASIPEVNDEQ